jgi:hypothetical protein
LFGRSGHPVGARKCDQQGNLERFPIQLDRKALSLFSGDPTQSLPQIVVTGRGETRFEEALVEAHRRRPDAIGVDIGFDDGDAGGFLPAAILP